MISSMESFVARVQLELLIRTFAAFLHDLRHTSASCPDAWIPRPLMQPLDMICDSHSWLRILLASDVKNLTSSLQPRSCQNLPVECMPLIICSIRCGLFSLRQLFIALAEANVIKPSPKNMCARRNGSRLQDELAPLGKLTRMEVG